MNHHGSVMETHSFVVDLRGLLFLGRRCLGSGPGRCQQVGDPSGWEGQGLPTGEWLGPHGTTIMATVRQQISNEALVVDIMVIRLSSTLKRYFILVGGFPHSTWG